jgi:hypothetical protein
MPKTPEHFTEESAKRLEQNIREYWASQGYDVESIGVKTQIEGLDAVVRSSGLIGGMPVGKPKRVAKKFSL